MSNESAVAAMIAGTQRFSNKTTVEQEMLNNHQYSSTIGKPHKNSQGLVLP